MSPTAKCPECGGALVDGMTCWEQFGAILAWEWHDSALAAEHFLTVASYNLQHLAQFTQEALDGLRASLNEYLDEGVSVDTIRKRMGNKYEGKTRVLKPESEKRPVLRTWGLTVDHVYLPDQPQGAAGRVREWAQAIQKELKG